MEYFEKIQRKEEEEEESVLKLIAPEKTRFEKSPRYKSKFRSSVKADFKKNQALKGCGLVTLPDPKEYLHKHTRMVPPRPEIVEPRCLAKEKKPPLPQYPVKRRKENVEVGDEAKEEKTPAGKEKDSFTARPDNSFRIKNIVNVMHSKPPKKEKKIADTSRGDKQLLIPSGLTPVYLYKKDYGKVPRYLSEKQKELQKQILHEEKKPEDGITYIEGETRKKLLQGLKQNWNELQTAYQQLPMMIDTIPKIKKKQQLEIELMKLEKDIEIIEKHPVICFCTKDNQA